jgi:hypothetical protein
MKKGRKEGRMMPEGEARGKRRIEGTKEGRKEG